MSPLHGRSTAWRDVGCATVLNEGQLAEDWASMVKRSRDGRVSAGAYTEHCRQVMDEAPHCNDSVGAEKQIVWYWPPCFSIAGC